MSLADNQLFRRMHKMHMHILLHPRLLLLCLSTMLMRTGMNTGSRIIWTGPLYSLSFVAFMLFKAIPNLVNSGKSTSLLSYDYHSLASKAPLMIIPSTWPLSKVPKSHLLHQVDDFAVACPNEELAKRY